MAGKPFSVQAPQDIAKEYGGNKQKIAHAVQAGLIDPTSGVLAGMFIDRMRSAQMQEQMQAPSVAQQVLAPPHPAMSPGMGAPPPGMGAPPPGMGAPPPGMAEGGFVPPYASGGLDGLPVPDTMFDESRNGGFNDGYAGGGIVAFAGGDYVDPTSASFGNQVQALREYIPQMQALYGQPGGDGTAFNEQVAALKKLRSPEEQSQRKKDDMWMALAQIGANMAASKSPYFLQAAGEAAQSALPGIAASAKDRRQEERDALKQSVDMELMQYGFKTKSIDGAMNILRDTNELVSKGMDRSQANELAVMKNKTDLLDIASRERIAGMQVGATREQTAATREQTAAYREDQLSQAATKNAQASADKAVAMLPDRTPKQRETKDAVWQAAYNRAISVYGNYGAPPPGAVTKVPPR